MNVHLLAAIIFGVVVGSLLVVIVLQAAFARHLIEWQSKPCERKTCE